MKSTPPQRTPFPEQEPYQARSAARSFGSDPERYDRARPHYPDALIEAVVAASPGGGVLDVGIGTGIAARQFRAAGCRVLGVEVDERMAEFARRSGFEVEVSAFEDWEHGGRTFDAVVSGQTWHWINPVAGAARAAEMLRPAGLLAVFWNVFDPAAQVAQAFSTVYRRVMSGYDPWVKPLLDGYSRILTRATDGMRQAGAFGEPQQLRFDWSRTYTRDEWLEQVCTGGDVSRFPVATLDALLAGIGGAVDELGGSFTMRYAAVAVTALRLGDA